MKKVILLGFLLQLLLLSVSAQDFFAYQKKYFIQRQDTLPYRILLPLNYDTTKTYPLILFLHGSGERGTNNESQLNHGADLFLRDSIRGQYPAIVVFPQCRENSFWSNVARQENKSGKDRYVFQTGGKPTNAMAMLQQLVKHLIASYPINTKKLYVGGLSMGGMGTFEIVYRNPALFAAAFPICGGADTASASRFRKTAWWIFHGAKDDIVLPEFSERIVNALQKIKANVTFTLYPEANHNSWDSALAEPGLLPWLFSKHK